MNTIRDHFPEQIEQLKPLLRRAYQAILEYQENRQAEQEAKMRETIRATLPILNVFKPHIPAYKARFLELLDARLTPYDLILCFDRGIYELHMRVKSGEWAHLPWSQNLRDLLNERQVEEPIALREESFVVSGKGVSRGIAEGTARIVVGTVDFAKIQKGDIVVSPMTTPDFVIVAKRIAGIVTDRGGSLCHAAILAREYGLPCIVGCQNATQLISDGQWVRLDATSGVVMRVDAH